MVKLTVLYPYFNYSIFIKKFNCFSSKPHKAYLTHEFSICSIDYFDLHSHFIHQLLLNLLRDHCCFVLFIFATY